MQSILEWLKTFGPAQNILGPVKGQGIRKRKFWSNTFDPLLTYDMKIPSSII